MNTDQCRRPQLSLGLAVLSLGFAACSSVLPEAQVDAVRHFTLAGPTVTAAVPDGVRVQPVQVAGHLRNRAMAVRVAENEVIYLDEVAWAEPIADGITQTLRNRLAAISADAVVSVQIQRCELDRSAGNTVQVVATYTILTGGGDHPGEERGLFTASRRTWDGGDHGALVALLREAVVELSEQLVAKLPEKK